MTAIHTVVYHHQVDVVGLGEGNSPPGDLSTLLLLVLGVGHRSVI